MDTSEHRSFLRVMSDGFRRPSAIGGGALRCIFALALVASCVGPVLRGADSQPPAEQPAQAQEAEGGVEKETQPVDRAADDGAAPTAVPDAGLAPPEGAVQGGSAPADDVSMNFRGVPLETVLDHLSAAAGFVIVKEVEVTGTVDVRSYQALGHDELVDLLNTLLNAKGFAAVRTGRILKIVSRSDARTQDLPIRSGGEPEDIPQGDHMVTQIIPVRHANALKLVDNLQPLLPGDVTLSANESSNAILLTATSSTVRRAAEIIKALDTSISSILDVNVFPLEYADAEQLAKMITQVFRVPQPTRQNSRRGGSRMSMMFRRQGGGDQQANQGGNSEAKAAASQVAAVGDPTTNTLVVSAPSELMPSIEELVSKVDVPAEDTVDIAVIPLTYSDPDDIARTISSLFSQNTRSGGSGSRSRSGRGGFFSRMRGRRGGGNTGTGGGGNTGTGTGTNTRNVREAEVVATADSRTNSVIVKASPASLEIIKTMVEQLDADPAKAPQVYVYEVGNADIEQLKETLEGMFTELEGSGNRRRVPNRQNTNRRTNRTQNTRGQRGNSGGTRGSSNRGFGGR